MKKEAKHSIMKLRKSSLKLSMTGWRNMKLNWCVYKNSYKFIEKSLRHFFQMSNDFHFSVCFTLVLTTIDVFFIFIRPPHNAFVFISWLCVLMLLSDYGYISLAFAFIVQRSVDKLLCLSAKYV